MSKIFAEDLISLLDSGLHGDQPSVIIDADALYGDDVWGYASIRRRTTDKAGIVILYLFSMCMYITKTENITFRYMYI